MNTDASALATWLGLMTLDELADLASSLDRLASYRATDGAAPVVTFLQALDALVIAEQRRRIDPEARGFVPDALTAVSTALADLRHAHLQVLLHSWSRIARNRERDRVSSEPVQRFHTAISDLLHAELAARLRP